MWSRRSQEPRRRPPEPGPEPARAAADQGGHPILRLQRSVGNRALQRLMVQRSTKNASARLEEIRRINDMTWAGPDDEATLLDLWDTFDDLTSAASDHWDDLTRSVDKGMNVDELLRRQKSRGRNAALVKIWLIHEYNYVGPKHELELARLWGSYGDDFPTVAATYLPTLRTSVDRGMPVAHVAPAAAMLRRFKGDVIGVAQGFVQANHAAVVAERKKLGLGGATEPGAGEARERMVRDAARLRLLIDARDRLGEITVGWDVGTSSDEYRSAEDREGGAETREPAYFDPDRQPHQPPDQGDPAVDWAVVNESHRVVTGAIDMITASSPLLYTAVAGGRLDELLPAGAADDDKQDPISAAASMLDDVDEKITATGGRLRSGALTWDEFPAVVDQLTAGDLAGASGTDWSTDLHRHVIESELGDLADYRRALMAADLLVGTGLLFVPGGVLLRALIGGIQLGHAYASWEELRDAAAQGTSAGTELVTDEAVQGAATQLAITAVTSVFDVASGLGALRRTARARAAAGGGPDEEIERAIAAIGKPGTAAGDLKQVGRRGRADKIPDIGNGVTREVAAMTREVFGRTIAQAPKSVQECWKAAVDMARAGQAALTAEEALEAYEKAQADFWRRVRIDKTARNRGSRRTDSGSMTTRPARRMSRASSACSAPGPWSRSCGSRSITSRPRPRIRTARWTRRTCGSSPSGTTGCSPRSRRRTRSGDGSRRRHFFFARTFLAGAFGAGANRRSVSQPPGYVAIAASTAAS